MDETRRKELQATLDSFDEEDRLKSLSNEELVDEALALGLGFHSKAIEMFNRLDPGWLERQPKEEV